MIRFLRCAALAACIAALAACGGGSSSGQASGGGGETPQGVSGVKTPESVSVVTPKNN